MNNYMPREIIRFKVNTEEYVQYDGSNLPINISSFHNTTTYKDEEIGYEVSNYFLLSDANGNPFPVFICKKSYQIEEGEWYIDNAILYYKHSEDR